MLKNHLAPKVLLLIHKEHQPPLPSTIRTDTDDVKRSLLCKGAEHHLFGVIVYARGNSYLSLISTVANGMERLGGPTQWGSIEIKKYRQL